MFIVILCYTVSMNSTHHNTLEERVTAIEERNKRVESPPLTNAFIPTVAFVVSTMSAESVKNRWLKNRQ